MFNTYSCSIPYFDNGELLTTSVMALSRSKARYAFWRGHCDCLLPYKDCFNAIKVKLVGKSKPSDIFGDAVAFKQVTKQREIEFVYQGMKIDVAGKVGIIIGSNYSANLDVLFEGQTVADNCHPTWETTYFATDGTIIKDFKKQNQ